MGAMHQHSNGLVGLTDFLKSRAPTDLRGQGVVDPHMVDDGRHHQELVAGPHPADERAVDIFGPEVLLVPPYFVEWR